jgi:DNA-binding NtrC family response regulator
VKVYLPRTFDAVQPEQPVVRVRPRVIPASILVVEDEETVRTLLQKVLHRHGYRVTTAGSAADAGSLLETDGLKVDLLITDVVLAQDSGRDLATMVQQRQPGARVLYISGYTDDAVVRHGILTEEMPFLQKPFSTTALLEKVSEILAARSV